MHMGTILSHICIAPLNKNGKIQFANTKPLGRIQQNLVLSLVLQTWYNYMHKNIGRIKIIYFVYVKSSSQCIRTVRLSWHKFITHVITKYQYPISNALGNELISP